MDEQNAEHRVILPVSQITTITFFRYAGLSKKAWAFGMMQFAHAYLKDVEGLTFYKLLGTGKGAGFNPWPDYSTYALLQVWETERAAEVFLKESRLMKKYRSKSVEQWTLYMHALKAEGEWSGANPFKVEGKQEKGIELVAVITRASIRKSRLFRFWKYVPTSQKPLERGVAGLLYTKGIGEVPFLQMATFSIWEKAADMQAFAYKTKEHMKAIQLTRELNWYSEELFSRFQPYRSEGTWKGKNPLQASEALQ